jgi:hypothetical protein
MSEAAPVLMSSWATPIASEQANNMNNTSRCGRESKYLIQRTASQSMDFHRFVLSEHLATDL